MSLPELYLTAIIIQTRLFVTNSLSFLPQTDEIWMLDEGVIQESGSYEDLRNKNGMFADFIKNFLESKISNEITKGKTYFVSFFFYLSINLFSYIILDIHLENNLNVLKQKMDHKIKTKENLIGVEKVEIGKVLEILFILQYKLRAILLFYYLILR